MRMQIALFSKRNYGELRIGNGQSGFYEFFHGTKVGRRGGAQE